MAVEACGACGVKACIFQMDFVLGSEVHPYLSYLLEPSLITIDLRLLLSLCSRCLAGSVGLGPSLSLCLLCSVCPPVWCPPLFRRSSSSTVYSATGMHSAGCAGNGHHLPGPRPAHHTANERSRFRVLTVAQSFVVLHACL
jgi:hypothetical protein